MTPFWEDPWLTMCVGDCRAVMAAMEPESVQTVISSPPYFGLREYGLSPAAWGGDPDHDHEWGASIVERATNHTDKRRWQHTRNGREEEQPPGKRVAWLRTDVAQGAFCPCGAWLGNLGLEPDPFLFVEHMVEVFRAVRRVLLRDGTVWLNLGDSYASHDPGDFKAKDRMLIPARVAIALCDDGWWVRDEIVWHKPNPMPSSVGDRTTPAHEMVYLLSKRARYYYDADAIREPAVGTTAHDLTGLGTRSQPPGRSPQNGNRGRVQTAATYRDKTVVDPNRRGLRQAPEPGEANAFHPLGRNKRSVWTIATQPYPDTHFATFPEALVEPMVLAGSPRGGVVLDPFGGSGTVAMVANRLGRRAVHIDLSPEYAAQAIRRIAKSRASGEGPAIDMPVPFADDGLWSRCG